MTQKRFLRQVAQATGESVATIRRLGFSLACPPLARFDPEPLDARVDDTLDGYVDHDVAETLDDNPVDNNPDAEPREPGPRVIDWDEVDAQRMSIFPAHYGRAAA